MEMSGEDNIEKNGVIKMKPFHLKALIVLMFAGLLSLSFTNKTDVCEAAAGDLRVGMEAGYAPFNWTQSNSSNGAVPIQGSSDFANGYDVQIAKLIAKRLGKNIIVVKTSWDGLPPALTSGKIDLIIAGMSPTAQRRKTIDFSDTYYQSNLTIVVRKNGKFAKAKSLKSFRGAKLTAQLNTYHYQAIEQIPKVIKEKPMNNFPAMRVALESGVIDGYVSEVPEGITAETSNPNLTYIRFDKNHGFKTKPEDTDLAIGLRKGSPLKSKINTALTNISQARRNSLMKEAVNNQPQTRSKGNWFISLIKQYGRMLVSGTVMTIVLALVGTAVGFIIGLLVGIVRTAPKPQSKFKKACWMLFNWFLSIYIEVFRGTPMIVQAAVIYYGAAQAFGLNMNRTLAALIIVSINTGAYLSEILRGGIISVDQGQFEAAHALGFHHFQTMRRIILPQAIRNSIPAVTNEFLVNIKDTSVLSVIAVSELFFSAETIAGQSFQFFHTYLIVCAIYLALTFTISRLFRILEKKLDGRSDYIILSE